jgi:hypothetical protein
MKLHSFQIILGVHPPETAIVDAMLEVEPLKHYKHVRTALHDFVHVSEERGKVIAELIEYVEELKSRVADPA